MKQYFKAISVMCFFLAVILYAFGCENSENPASDPEEVEPVPELMGVWRAQWSDDEVQFYHVGEAGGNLPESMLRVELVTHKKNGELKTHDQLMIVIPGDTGDKPILGAAAVDREVFTAMQKEGWNAEEVGDYFLFTYRLEGENLFLRGVDHNEKRRVIEKGIIEGEVTEREAPHRGMRARLTARTEELAEFLASPDADKFFAEREFLLERLNGAK